MKNFGGLITFFDGHVKGSIHINYLRKLNADNSLEQLRETGV